MFFLIFLVYEIKYKQIFIQLRSSSYEYVKKEAVNIPPPPTLTLPQNIFCKKFKSKRRYASWKIGKISIFYVCLNQLTKGALKTVSIHNRMGLYFQSSIQK